MADPVVIPPAITATPTTNQTMYPVIKSSEEVQLLINSALNDKNAVLVKKDVITKQNQLHHYEKVLARSKKTQKICTLAIIIFGVLLGLTSIIVGFLIDFSYVKNSTVTEIIDLILLIFLTPTGIVVNAFLQNKIDNWTKIIKGIKQCIDQVYVIWFKAATDNIITDDELAVFVKIFAQTDTQIKVDENTSAVTENVLQQVESIFSNAALAIQTLAKKP
jgi:hypothetical protein